MKPEAACKPAHRKKTRKRSSEGKRKTNLTGSYKTALSVSKSGGCRWNMKPKPSENHSNFHSFLSLPDGHHASSQQRIVWNVSPSSSNGNYYLRNITGNRIRLWMLFKESAWLIRLFTRRQYLHNIWLRIQLLYIRYTQCIIHTYMLTRAYAWSARLSVYLSACLFVCLPFMLELIPPRGVATGSNFYLHFYLQYLLSSLRPSCIISPHLFFCGPQSQRPSGDLCCQHSPQAALIPSIHHMTHTISTQYGLSWALNPRALKVWIKLWQYLYNMIQRVFFK